jgi:uncharacterized damage-inducible protein DinB
VDARVALLVDILDESFDRKGWQGTVLRGAIRGIDARQATWKPARDRHSIADYVLHAAYWKYTVRRRLLGEKRGSFPRKGSNFFSSTSALTDAEWRADVQLLVEQHRALRDAVAAFPPKRLDERTASAKWTNAQLIYGVAAHDVYHTGQIQLLKRLQGL